MFLISVFDIYHNPSTGADNISVVFSHEDVSQSLEVDDYASITSPALLVADTQFIGNETWLGYYLAEWSPVLAGRYELSVQTPVNLEGGRIMLQHLSGSPMQVI